MVRCVTDDFRFPVSVEHSFLAVVRSDRNVTVRLTDYRCCTVVAICHLKAAFDSNYFH